jgi:alkaline phosphatase
VTPRPRRPFPFRRALAVAGLAALAACPARAADRIKELQNSYVEGRTRKMDRAYHFGSQGPGSYFSNHATHTNRLIPVYVFGRKADLGAVTGKNSRYRDAAKVKELYGVVPANTVNPEAEYADQSDLYRVQEEAVRRGAKYLFTVWFDGLDWDTTRAAAIARTGKVYDSGKGSGLAFQDYGADGSAQFGFFVASPTHDKNRPDVDAQTVTIPAESLGGGYDPRLGGPNPWTPGPPKAAGYLKGQSASPDDRRGVEELGGVLHAYTDSAPSAGEYATGVKSYNNGINVADDGRFVPTLFNRLQGRGWRVGTATSVPFDHASPAAIYAHNVNRDDYQDLARDMLGLRSIAQEAGREDLHAGLDVVLGAGYGQTAPDQGLEAQGKNAVTGGNIFLADRDRAAIDVANGGKYVVAQTAPKVDGSDALQAAAERAAKGGHRLFGFYGTNVNHLPYRTADGGYDPANGLRGTAEVYSQADRLENPTLADMTRSALTVLAAEPGKPFALFVEAGDVDFALHDNNLDNAIGAIYSGEEAVQVIIDWVERQSNWDESVLIVTADHGHYLVVDHPEALAPPRP